MRTFVGLDVSVKETSICIVSGSGEIVRERKVPTEPGSIISVLRGIDGTVRRIARQNIEVNSV